LVEVFEDRENSVFYLVYEALKGGTLGSEKFWSNFTKDPITNFISTNEFLQISNQLFSAIDYRK